MFQLWLKRRPLQLKLGSSRGNLCLMGVYKQATWPYSESILLITISNSKRNCFHCNSAKKTTNRAISRFLLDKPRGPSGWWKNKMVSDRLVSRIAWGLNLFLNENAAKVCVPWNAFPKIKVRQCTFKKATEKIFQDFFDSSFLTVNTRRIVTSFH